MFRATLAAWERVPRDCLSAGVENLPLPRAVDATTLGINIPAIVPETDLLSASARDTVARESRTVAWALHDTAARILQEEVRHYARSRLKRRLKFEAIQDEDRAKGMSPHKGYATRGISSCSNNPAQGGSKHFTGVLGSTPEAALSYPPCL